MICWQKGTACFVLLVLCLGPARAQTCATTDIGRQVLLSEDGSWRYARDNECEPSKRRPKSSATTEVRIGQQRYPAGFSEPILEDGLHTIKAQIVDRNGQALLVLWSESEGACTYPYFGDETSFQDHDTRLFLSSGEMVKFIDRGNKGSRTLRDARTRTETTYMLGEATEIEKEVDVCEQWIAYRITNSEVDKLGESMIARIEMETGMSASSEQFRVERNRDTLAKQIRNLGL